MNNERITVSELLFRPSDMVREKKPRSKQAGIAETITHCIRAVAEDAEFCRGDPDVSATLVELFYGSVRVVGGSARIPGLKARLYVDGCACVLGNDPIAYEQTYSTAKMNYVQAHPSRRLSTSLLPRTLSQLQLKAANEWLLKVRPTLWNTLLAAQNGWSMVSASPRHASAFNRHNKHVLLYIKPTKTRIATITSWFTTVYI